VASHSANGVATGTGRNSIRLGLRVAGLSSRTQRRCHGPGAVNVPEGEGQPQSDLIWELVHSALRTRRSQSMADEDELDNANPGQYLSNINWLGRFRHYFVDPSPGDGDLEERNHLTIPIPPIAGHSRQTAHGRSESLTSSLNRTLPPFTEAQQNPARTCYVAQYISRSTLTGEFRFSLLSP
jgi:hypothetical protein